MTNNDVPNSRQSLEMNDKMTRDDIERIASDAGIVVTGEAVVKLCELVAAAEREACAKVCDAFPFLNADQCATAIRMRGEK